MLTYSTERHERSMDQTSDYSLNIDFGTRRFFYLHESIECSQHNRN